MGLQRVGYNLATEQQEEEAIQWLRLCASNARDSLQSLVGEQRSHRLCSMAKKISKKLKVNNTVLMAAQLCYIYLLINI